MKPLYLVMIPLVLLASCVFKEDKKSVLQFQVNNRSVASVSVANLEQGGLVVRMSDRYYVSSLLLDVFGATAAMAVNNYVKARMDNFGGGCDQYDRNLNTSGTCLNDDCNNITCSGSNIINNQIGVSSVIRQGWITRACEDISGDDNAVLYAVKNIYGQSTLTKTTVTAPTNDSLIRAYDLFYRSVSPSSTVVSALANVAAKETTNNFEKWRYVLLSICTTSEWQIP